MSVEQLTYLEGGGHSWVVAELKARITHLELAAGGYRADFERERGRADRRMVNLLEPIDAEMQAKEAAARSEGRLAELRSPPWWRRPAG